MRLPLFVALYLALGIALPGCAQERALQQYVHTTFEEREGAPNQIMALAQTADGYLWLSSMNGTYRFDGVTFELFRDIKLFACSYSPQPNGDLWVGGLGGIERVRDGQTIDYSTADGVPDARVLGFAVDKTGRVWASTMGGLIYLDGKRWVTVGADWKFPGKVAQRLFLDSHGTLWVSAGHTIVFLRPGAHAFQPTGMVTVDVSAFAEAPDGRVWVADIGKSVRPVSLRGDSDLSSKPEIRILGGTGLLFDRAGALWISSRSGLWRIAHPEKLEPRVYQTYMEPIESFEEKDGATGDDESAIVQDREGNVWVASYNGLDCFHKGTFVPVVPPFKGTEFLLTPDRDGAMWFSSGRNMVHTKGDGKFTAVTQSPHYYTESQLGPDGDIWWSTDHGLYLQRNEKLTQVLPDPDKTSSAPVPLPQGDLNPPRVVEDQQHTLWVALPKQGIYFKTREGLWGRLSTSPAVTNASCNGTFLDHKGRPWFMFGEGFAVYIEAGVVHKVDAPKGGDLFAADESGGHFWIGGVRVHYFDGHTMHELSPAPWKAFTVRGMYEDSDGSLWLNENRGILHIPAAEIQAFLKDYSHRVSFELYDSRDGIPGRSPAGYARSSLVQGTDGRLWFTSSGGAAWIDPYKKVENALPPPVFVRMVYDNGKPYKPQHGLKLPPLADAVSISYTATSLSIPSRVQFRYRLEGVDKAWQDPGTRREAFYTKLSPGRYRFHVIACNNDGVWNNEGAWLEFRIAPAWFQTWWFYLFCTGVVLSLLGLAYRLRLRQLSRAMDTRFNERMAERTRIARDLHDTLLQTIQGSKLVATNAAKDPRDAARMQGALLQLSEWLTLATEEGRRALQFLRNSSSETTNLIVSLHRVLEDTCGEGSQIKGSVRVTGESREMQPIVCDELSMIGYEAIRNACVHSQGNRIDISVTFAEDFSLMISDNGVGMDNNALQGERQGHFGMHSMRERTASIGGQIDITSSVGSGTQVRVNVDGKRAYLNPRPGRFGRLGVLLSARLKR